VDKRKEGSNNLAVYVHAMNYEERMDIKEFSSSD
jgi:hypothetical protein